MSEPVELVARDDPLAFRLVAQREQGFLAPSRFAGARDLQYLVDREERRLALTWGVRERAVTARVAT
jgi:hypothetical protein